jgi:hypothetical protein
VQRGGRGRGRGRGRDPQQEQAFNGILLVVDQVMLAHLAVLVLLPLPRCMRSLVMVTMAPLLSVVIPTRRALGAGAGAEAEELEARRGVARVGLGQDPRMQMRPSVLAARRVLFVQSEKKVQIRDVHFGVVQSQSKNKLFIFLLIYDCIVT